MAWLAGRYTLVLFGIYSPKKPTAPGSPVLFVVNLCFVFGYETSQKLVWIAVELSQTILRSCICGKLRVNAAPSMRIAFSHPNDHSTSKQLNHVIWHDLAHFQFLIGQYHNLNLFNCFGCSELNWEFRTFSVTCSCATTTKLKKEYFLSINWMLQTSQTIIIDVFTDSYAFSSFLFNSSQIPPIDLFDIPFLFLINSIPAVRKNLSTIFTTCLISVYSLPLIQSIIYIFY